MPYTLSWYLPGRIILMEGDGTITTEDVRTFAQRGVEMVASGKPLVHFIIDFRQVQKIESIPGALKALQQNPPHADMGWVIFIGGMNPIISYLGDIAAAVIRMRYHRCATFEEALAFLKERDITLAL